MSNLLFTTSSFMVDWVHFAIRNITGWVQISSNKLRPYKMTGNRHPIGMATFAKASSGVFDEVCALPDYRESVFS